MQMVDDSLPVDLNALAAWMDEQRLENGPLEEIQLMAGGTQNILLKFWRGSHDFVLRRPPLHLRENSNSTMSREARVLKALSGSAVPHPGFIAGCEDESVLGAGSKLRGCSRIKWTCQMGRRRIACSMREKTTSLESC